MLTVSEDEGRIFEAIKSGASGYLLKSLDANEFVGLLTDVMRGEVPLPPALAARVLAELTKGDHERRPFRPTELTPRQWEILTLVTQGLTYKEIGASLHLTEQTVKYHMGQILDRLHLVSREQAIAYARRTGLG